MEQLTIAATAEGLSRSSTKRAPDGALFIQSKLALLLGHFDLRQLRDPHVALLRKCRLPIGIDLRQFETAPGRSGRYNAHSGAIDQGEDHLAFHFGPIDQLENKQRA